MDRTSLTNCRILLVEDEYMLADELVTALAEVGATVLGPFATAGEAIEFISDESPIDAAILDVNLGGEVVTSVADMLCDRGIPFLFTTGYDPAIIPTRFQNVILCEKPLSIAAVLVAMKQLMGASATAARLAHGEKPP